jgi:glycosyltransferase involved in cell wall biosynthesis
MKIGISTSVIQRGKTGIAQYVFGLVRGLIETAPTNDYVLFVLEEDRPLFSFAANALQIVTIPERVRPPVRDIAWHQTELPRLARKLQLDVLHVPSYRRMIWSRPCGMVATIHDLAPFHVSRKYDWKRMLYGRVVARRLAHRQHEIIAISENTSQDISRYFGVRKVQVVHNGIDHTEFFRDSHEAAREKIAREYRIDKPFFLYLARLEHPGKNHVRLIEAFNQFKTATASDWQMVFGGSDWSGAEHIHRAIKESPFARDIRSLGFVPNSMLPTLYRAASVFVYPSLYEGFGMPPLEAMACGCPVISSTGGALREMVANAGVLVNPEDTTELASQMTRLASDSALREQLRSTGLARAQKFTWQAAARATVDVYARAAQVKESSNVRPPVPVAPDVRRRTLPHPQ